MKWLLPPILFVLCIGAMALLDVTVPIRRIVPEPYNLAGIALVLGGIGVALWGSRKFRQIGTNVRTFDQPDHFVTDGLFRYTRNPMYLGLAVALLGIATALGTISPLFVWVVFVVVTDRWYIPFEERMMEQTFGDAYRDYKRSTRRWI